MTRTCENCLNAYNNPHDAEVRCVKKDWESQFRDIDVTVHKGETCGTFRPRNSNQPKVVFGKPVQLTFDF